MQDQLTSSLVALSLLAARGGNMQDAAQMLVHAAHTPGVESFLEQLLCNNVEADVMTRSVLSNSSATDDLFTAIESLQCAMVSVSSDVSGLYEDDEFISVSAEDEEEDDETGVDLEVIDLDEDEDEDEDADAKSTSASGVTLDLS